MNIGFVAVRLFGVDGVSLEADKWVQVLKKLGHKIYFCTGEIMDPNGYSLLTGDSYLEINNTKVVPRMKLKSRENLRIHKLRYSNEEELLKELIETEASYLKNEMFSWVKENKIDLLIIENASSFPAHIPLGVAIARLIRGEDIPAILHHHDFGWEREKFKETNKIFSEYMTHYFPFDHRRVRHIVINKNSKTELKKRYKIKSAITPNVFPYECMTNPKDDYNKDFKVDFNLDKKDLIVLAPVRVVPRKDLRTAIKIVSALDKRLDQHVVLVVTGYTTDVGKPHERNLRRLAEKLNCDIRFIGDRIKARRYAENGRKYYSIFDTYPYSDFVVYPSTCEGWGNAFGEAVAFKKLIVVRRYPVYRTDIEPLGFKVISFNKYCKNVVNRLISSLNNPEEIQKMADDNFEIAKKKLGYNWLENKLEKIITSLNEQVV